MKKGVYVTGCILSGGKSDVLDERPPQSNISVDQSNINECETHYLVGSLVSIKNSMHVSLGGGGRLRARSND